LELGWVAFAGQSKTRDNGFLGYHNNPIY